MAATKTFYDRTGLGRSLDPKHPNTWRVLTGSGIAFAIALFRAEGFDLRPAVLAGGAVFLAWAIARELDPDHRRSADLAMIIAFGFSLDGDVSLGAVGISLIALRLIAGTVGRRVFPSDTIVLLVAAGIGGANPAAWPAVVALIVVIVLDSSLPRTVPIAMMTISASAAALFADVLAVAVTAGGVALAGLVAISALTPPGSVASPTDSGRHSITPQRVRSARVTAAAVFIAAAIVTATVSSVAPLAAALIGTAVVWVWRRTATDVRPVAPVAPSSTSYLR